MVRGFPFLTYTLLQGEDSEKLRICTKKMCAQIKIPKFARI
jgi:predicted RNA-binding Zn ribbon-like protein